MNNAPCIFASLKHERTLLCIAAGVLQQYHKKCLQEDQEPEVAKKKTGGQKAGRAV